MLSRPKGVTVKYDLIFRFQVKTKLELVKTRKRYRQTFKLVHSLPHAEKKPMPSHTVLLADPG